MGALDILKSERGLAFIAVLLAATVLTALGHLPSTEWKEMTLYVFGAYVAGKSVTSAVAAHSAAKVEIARLGRTEAKVADVTTEPTPLKVV